MKKKVGKIEPVSVESFKDINTDDVRTPNFSKEEIGSTFIGILKNVIPGKKRASCLVEVVPSREFESAAEDAQLFGKCFSIYGIPGGFGATPEAWASNINEGTLFSMQVRGVNLPKLDKDGNLMRDKDNNLIRQAEQTPEIVVGRI